MKKNVASQTVVAQLISATDGSDVTTGTPTVYVLGDGGTQASGTGTVTHEGHGCWSYVPAQSETDYDHVAFTFVLFGAISVTVQAYTTYPQTGDTFASLPTNFSDLAITSSTGKVTVGTNSDKTGYSLTQSFPSNFASLAITAGGAVTAGTVSDKTGYSLTQSFPTNFADLAITATTGKVTVGTNSDKTGYSISGTKTTLDALNDIAAADVWSVSTRVLTADTNLSGMDVNVTKINDVTITGDGSTNPFDVA